MMKMTRDQMKGWIGYVVIITIVMLGWQSGIFEFVGIIAYGEFTAPARHTLKDDGPHHIQELVGHCPSFTQDMRLPDGNVLPAGIRHCFTQDEVNEMD